MVRGIYTIQQNQKILLNQQTEHISISKITLYHKLRNQYKLKMMKQKLNSVRINLILFIMFVVGGSITKRT